jgi:DNA-binding PadR family transcriptional regulator
MYKLSKHQELVLLAIWKLAGNAYIVTIRKYFKEITGETINTGSLCNTLNSLMKKGYIESEDSDPLAQPGGRRKVLYFLTPVGKKALNHAHEIQMLSWGGFVKFGS